MITKSSIFFLAALFPIFSATAVAPVAQSQTAKAVSGCELLRHPSRYNGRMVIVSGRYTVGFERSDIALDCSESVGAQLSLTHLDLIKYGFLTEDSTLDAMSQLPPGEHPGDNLTARKVRFAPVKVVGLFRCHFDYPTCKGSSPNDGSIIVESMQFNAPMAEAPQAAKSSSPPDTLSHESGHGNSPQPE